MTFPDSAALANLARIGKLKVEPPDARERAGLLRSATVRLQDARQPTLSLESRFDLAYNAAHAAALSALRIHGYRSENRYLVMRKKSQQSIGTGALIGDPLSAAQIGVVSENRKNHTPRATNQLAKTNQLG